MTLTHTQTGHRPERVAFAAEAQTVKFVVPAPYRPVGAPPVSPDDAQHARIERLAAQGKANGVRVYRSRYANEWKVTSQQRDAITGARHPGYTVRLSDGRYCCNTTGTSVNGPAGLKRKPSPAIPPEVLCNWTIPRLPVVNGSLSGRAKARWPFPEMAIGCVPS